jgi:hypothetical protein
MELKAEHEQLLRRLPEDSLTPAQLRARIAAVCSHRLEEFVGALRFANDQDRFAFVNLLDRAFPSSDEESKGGPADAVGFQSNGDEPEPEPSEDDDSGRRCTAGIPMHRPDDAVGPDVGFPVHDAGRPRDVTKGWPGDESTAPKGTCEPNKNRT